MVSLQWLLLGVADLKNLKASWSWILKLSHSLRLHILYSKRSPEDSQEVKTAMFGGKGRRDRSVIDTRIFFEVVKKYLLSSCLHSTRVLYNIQRGSAVNYHTCTASISSSIRIHSWPAVEYGFNYHFYIRRFWGNRKWLYENWSESFHWIDQIFMFVGASLDRLNTYTRLSGRHH